MKTHRFYITAVSILLSCLTTSCVSSRHVLVEFSYSGGRIRSTGTADRGAAREFFGPDVVFGPRPWNRIPTNATPCGVLIVTQGSDTKALPLLSWSSTNSVTQFGCDGPTSLFAVRESTKRQLFSTLQSRITGKANKPAGR